MICIIHDWTTWSELVPVVGSVNQFRYCKNCNKVSYRKAGEGYNFNLSAWNTPKGEK